MMTFGENLAFIRKANRMTQEKLAQRLFVSKKVICSWEADQVIPNIVMVLKLIEILDSSFEELTEGVEMIY